MNPDNLVKLRDVERAIAGYFHPDSQPSRNTIIGWIEEGSTYRQTARSR
jgi:hypothetical protein